MTNLGPEAFRKMTELQRAMSDVLNRANRERLPLDLAYFASLRVTRELLLMFPPGEGQRMMLALGVAFIEQQHAETDSKLITLH